MPLNNGEIIHDVIVGVYYVKDERFCLQRIEGMSSRSNHLSGLELSPPFEDRSTKGCIIDDEESLRSFYSSLSAEGSGIEGEFFPYPIVIK